MAGLSFGRYLMRKTCLLCWGLLLAAGPASFGQHLIFQRNEILLYFRKNGHRETVYRVGDALRCTVRGIPGSVAGRIRGFEGDSVLVLADDYRVRVRTISALYVDEKTRQWFILRYKYEKLLYLGGALFFPLNTVNLRQVQPQALAVSGALLGAGLLAHLLVSQRLKITGRRRLLIISS